MNYGDGQKRRALARAVMTIAAAAIAVSGLVPGAAAATESAASAPGMPHAPRITLHKIPVNTSNWSASAGFGSRSPGWYTDRSGIVHLRGAAKQTNAAGSKANLLGTLPKAARPSRNVFVIVHTFAGTYADVGIAANGKISLIDPRPPAVKDYTFVSLEEIAFKR